MFELMNEFFNRVSERSKFQQKYFKVFGETELDDSEKGELETFLGFFKDELHYAMDDIVAAYLFVNDMIMQETYYFLKNKHYRYSTFDEVNPIVYGNRDYMEKYMMGVSISDYIWIIHIKMLRYFKENLNMFFGENYLEIGPGGVNI